MNIEKTAYAWKFDMWQWSSLPWITCDWKIKVKGIYCLAILEFARVAHRSF